MPNQPPTPFPDLAYDDSPLAGADTTHALFNTEALAELQREVVHLRTAVEVLQRQNADLVSIRQAFELERRPYR